jgi:hypothetical protein
MRSASGRRTRRCARSVTGRRFRAAEPVRSRKPQPRAVMPGAVSFRTRRNYLIMILLATADGTFGR